MDEERRKRARPSALDEVDEERVFPALATIQSESDWDETNPSESETDQDDFSDEEFSRSDLEFLEDDHDYYTLEMEEEEEFDLEDDDIDPDELSYEELLALGERVGVENRGLSEVEISKHLHPLTCNSTSKLLIDRCVICQMEYEQEEKLASLRCDHPFHPDCITKWLQIKKICPICTNEVSGEETPRPDSKCVNDQL